MFDQMLASLVLIVGSLLAGLAFGLARKRLPAGEKKAVSRSMTAMVVVLIFLMGVKTGLNREVMAGLGVYGLKALLLAVGAIAGSVAFVVLLDRLAPWEASK